MFAKSAANEAAERILLTVSAVARRPELFAEGRAPDTFDGRFEMVTLFAGEALRRLAASAEADKVAQAFVDQLFKLFDAGLREAAVGDLTVPKRMKGIANAFYGRQRAYAAAGDRDALIRALSRNIWNVDDAAFAPMLADHLLEVRRVLGAAEPEALERIGAWPDLPPEA
jgi:cytochrome b pre-mRNA-processing protein 3